MCVMLEYCKPSREPACYGSEQRQRGTKSVKEETRNRETFIAEYLFHLCFLQVHLQLLCELVWTVDNKMAHMHGCINSFIQSAWFGKPTFRCNHQARKALHLFAARKNDGVRSSVSSARMDKVLGVNRNDFPSSTRCDKMPAN